MPALPYDVCLRVPCPTHFPLLSLRHRDLWFHNIFILFEEGQVGSTSEPCLSCSLGFSTMLLFLSTSALPLAMRLSTLPPPSFLLWGKTLHFLCASAGMSLVDKQSKNDKYWKIPQDVRGANRLNQHCVISSSSGLGETDIYGHVEVTHYSFNNAIK